MKVYSPEANGGLGGWQTLAATLNAAEVVVTNSNLTTQYDEDGNVIPGAPTNVETTLADLKARVDRADENISWLAAHGGGGAGGIGGGGNVSGTILVNNTPTSGSSGGGKVSLTDAGLTIKVNSSNASLLWEIGAEANGVSLGYAANTNELFISANDIYRKGTAFNSTFHISITAYNEATLTTLYWNGNIVINKVDVHCEDLSIDFNDINRSELVVSCVVGDEDKYILYINDKQFGEPFNVGTKGVTKTIRLTDITNPAINPGNNNVMLKLVKVSDPTVSGSYVAHVVAQTGEPLIICNEVSNSVADPTHLDLYGSSISIGIPFVVYHADDDGGYKYKIERKGETKEFSANSIKYNVVNENASYYLNNAEYSDDPLEFVVTIMDLNTLKEYKESFYIVLKKPTNAFLSGYFEDSELVFDFDAMTNKFNLGESWKSGFPRANETDEYVMNIEQSNQYSIVKNAEGSKGSHLRLQNAAYGVIDMDKADCSSLVVANSCKFSLELNFRSDYHPDDNHIVMQWGEIDENGIATRGIVVRSHDVWVNNNKLFSLEDRENVHLTFAFETNKSNKGYLFVYLDATPEYVGEFNYTQLIPGLTNSSLGRIYVGAGCHNGNVIYNTDCDIFRLKLYNISLSPYQTLFDFLNDQARTNCIDGTPNFTLITQGLNRNFITRDEEKADGEIIKGQSYLYDPSLNWSNNSEDMLSFFKLENFISQMNNVAQLKNDIKNFNVPLPIVFVDVSAQPLWTWTAFTTPQGANTKLDAVTGTFQYYDQKLSKDKITDTTTVVVEQQGTSTLADYLKNLTIKFKSTDHNVDSVFIPKPEWFPENEYTLKADIVDSSHSLNTSIGRFVNEELGRDEVSGASKWYPYSETVLKSFNEEKSNSNSTISKTFPKATLKHGVEGFPVFLIMKFAPERVNGSDEPISVVKTLGIYQFILGRKSPRNLGYEIIQGISNNDGTPIENISYPYLGNNVKVDVKTNEGVWFEFEQNDEWGKAYNFQEDGDRGFVGSKLTGAFWQESGEFYDAYVAEKYHNTAEDHIVSEFKPFTDFVHAIVQCPVNYKRYSLGGQFNRSEFTNSYDSYNYNAETKQWSLKEANGNSIAAKGDDLKGVIVQDLNLDCISKYFPLMMFWGLLDNFQKNMPIKFFKTNNGWEKAILGIYDTDSGCGQNNQAEITANEGMWICGIKNEEGGNLTECPAEQGINGGTIVATNNKLWTIDTNSLQYSGYGTDDKSSMFAGQWHSLRRLFPGNKLVDTFYNDYFLKQTDGCGELLFSLTFIAKYVNKYRTSAEDDSSKGNQIAKLHGRRRYQVKRWLQNRVKFLDSIFDMMGPLKDISTQSYTIPSTAFNAVTSPSTQITTNAPVIIHYTNQGANDRYVYCKPNTPTEVWMGGTELGVDSAKSHVFSNPDTIIKIGEGNYPLYDIGWGGINTGTFPYLLEYNVSAPTRSESNLNVLQQMDMSYMDKFKANGVSELRTIDFRNTMPKEPNYSYILNLENGFSKLQNLYIDNSCITSVTFPKDASLHDFSVMGSKLTELDLNEQNFIQQLNLTGCDALTSLRVNGCDNITNISLDRTNKALTTVSIQSPKLENFSCVGLPAIKNISLLNASSLDTVIIDSCESLQTLNIDVTNLRSLYIARCPRLTTINFVGSNSSCTADTLYPNLEEFRLVSTGVKYTSFAGEPDTVTIQNIGNNKETVQEVRLSRFPNLFANNAEGRWSIFGNDGIEYVSLPNDSSNRAIIGSSKYNSPGENEAYNNAIYGCSNLKRIFGNIRVKSEACFYQMKKFSLHGNDVRIINWNGKPVMKTATSDTYGRIMIPYEVMNPSVVATLDNVVEFNDVEILQSGPGVTNIVFDNAVNALRGTSATLFDIYYVFYQALRNGATVYDGMFSDCVGASIVDKLSTIDERGFKFTWISNSSLNNSPNKYMFASCSHIKSLCETLAGRGVGVFKIYSPNTTSSNDGLLSPLTGLEKMNNLFKGCNYYIDRNVFRSSVDFILSELDGFSPCKVVDNVNMLDNPTNEVNLNYDGNLTNFFDNLPNLTSIASLFDGLEYVNYDKLNPVVDRVQTYNFQIPHGVTTIVNVLHTKYASGSINFDYNECIRKQETPKLFSSYFQKNSQTNLVDLEHLCQSFRVDQPLNDKLAILYLDNYLFNGFNNDLLKSVGYFEIGKYASTWRNSSFNGNGLDKILVTTNDGTLPNSMIDKMINLEVFAGVFASSRLKSTTVGKLSLPNNLFVLNSSIPTRTRKLKNLSGLFYDVKFNFKLSPLNNNYVPYATNNFVPCVDLENVSYMFAQNIDTVGEETADRRTPVCSCSIPHAFFYHGEGNTTNLQFYGRYEGSTYTFANRPTNKVAVAVTDPNDDRMDGSQVIVNSYIMSRKVRTTWNHPDEPNVELFKEVLTETIYSGIELENVDVAGNTADIIITPATLKTIKTTTSYGTVGGTDVDSEVVQTTPLYCGNNYDDPECELIHGAVNEYVTLRNVYNTISDISYCFQHCDIQPYSRKITGDDIEGYDKFSPFKYMFDTSNRSWSVNSQQNSTKETVMYAYDGVYSDLGGFGNYFPSDDAEDTPYFIHAGPTVDGSKGTEISNFCCPPDLLRYCTPNCNISGLFWMCGCTGYNKDNHGGNPIWSWGLRGRIPSILLRHVYNATDISYMFGYCRNLCAYRQPSSNLAYIIPPSFFSYAPKINKMDYTFCGLFWPHNSDLNVFRSLDNSAALSLDHTFYKPYWEAGIPSTDISGIFATNGRRVSNVNACFAKSLDVTGTDDFPRDGGNVKFENIFQRGVYTSSSYSTVPEYQYCFYGYTEGTVSHETEKTLNSDSSAHNYDYA